MAWVGRPACSSARALSTTAGTSAAEATSTRPKVDERQAPRASAHASSAEAGTRDGPMGGDTLAFGARGVALARGQQAPVAPGPRLEVELEEARHEVARALQSG